MPTTKDAGRFFAHGMTYPSTDFPLVDKGVTQEIEHPFRLGKSVVLRAPFTRRAVVLGVWGASATDPDEALKKALRLFRAGDADVAVS